MMDERLAGRSAAAWVVVWVARLEFLLAEQLVAELAAELVDQSVAELAV